MGGGGCNSGRLFSVYPEELVFEPELGKACFCDIKLINTTKHHVAFKVKTTAPRKYFVRPNKGVVQPWDSQTITITHQALKQYPEDKRSMDKFLIQSTIVPATTDFDELPQDIFTEDDGRQIEEQKLGVVYTAAAERLEQEDEPFGMTQMHVQLERRLREELDAALRQNQQLRRELDSVRTARRRKGGFSLAFAVFVACISLLLGFILNLLST
ncbi:unnamed protein product [Spirodela intermedia]|uniref:MSP domain-containing protein n=1 Tax=Spirodela intermedia TaxID=51605 RepID=A0A7I8LAU1_SPIIN|nr:unnamed protein product [Spirodela intermedia]